MGCVYAYVIILTLIGPEYKGRSMGAAHDHDLEEAVGHDTIQHAANLHGTSGHRSSDEEKSEM